MFDEKIQSEARTTYLADNQVHIWQIALNQKDELLKILSDLLDDEEKSKALNFRFEKDRRNYITSHGAMREILSFYLEIRPQNIEFKTTFYGKPFLRRGAVETDISFNLSHSHEWALLAITKGKKIGIDIEFIRPGIAEENLAEQVFSTLEFETFRKLPKSLQAKAFFDCWTRKEAFIKAAGKGLSYPLKDFSVAFSPFEQARVIALEKIGMKVESWQLIDLRIAENYSAAAAVEAKETETDLFLWNYYYYSSNNT